VFYGNSSGSLSNVKVLNIQQPAANFGDQPGANGDVYVASCTGGSCPSTTGSATVTMTGVTATMYDKTGITCSGPATSCTISGSTVTGSGPLNDQAQNGIEDDYGATANITTTNVSGDAYTCNGVLNGACYSSSGILAFQDAGLIVTHSTVSASDDGIVPYEDTGAVTITNNTVSNGTDADVGSAQGIEPIEDGTSTPVTINNNIVNGDVGGGIYNYATGSDVTESGNTTENDSAVETICTVAGPPISGCTTAEDGGGIIDYADPGTTVGPGNIIENNAAGGVIDTASTSGTITGNTISNNTAGGVLLQASTGVTVSNNTLGSNAGGGVVGTSAPPGNQASNDTVSGNTINGTSGAGVELELTGGYTMTNNTVSGLGEGGEGFVLVGSDSDTVSNNTVSGSAAGIIVTGNDLTGPSTSSTISNNQFSNNLLGGAAADGSGSPESWNKPGSGNQGIQGTVFFQSFNDVPVGPITTTCPDAALTDCAVAVTPTGFSSASPPVPGAYEAVAGYLADAGAICNSSAPADGGVPVDQEGYTEVNPSPPTYVPNVVACTDGAGDIYLATPYTGVTVEITPGNGEATGGSTTSEPGCEVSPPSDTAAPSCTGSDLTLSDLPAYNTVSEGNTFNLNSWGSEAIAGAIDGSGPNGEFTAGAPTFADGNPDNPANIQNTWTNNTGTPDASNCNPTTAAPVCGS
jgi:parallel beta-helix repeat protein